MHRGNRKGRAEAVAVRRNRDKCIGEEMLSNQGLRDHPSMFSDSLLMEITTSSCLVPRGANGIMPDSSGIAGLVWSLTGLDGRDF